MIVLDIADIMHVHDINRFMLHRLDGPAFERSNGYKGWYYNGLRHREDGPAIIRPDGVSEWWHFGIQTRVHRTL